MSRIFIIFASNTVKKGISLTVLSFANVNVLLESNKDFANNITKILYKLFKLLKMKGVAVKEILRKMGVSLPDLAKKMGYKAEENLYSKLRSDDIKTNLLEEIAKATNKSISYFYNESIPDNNDSNNDNDTEIVSNNPRAIVNIMSELVKTNSVLANNNTVALNSNSELIQTNSKVVDSNSELIQTNAKVVDSNSELVQTNSKLVDAMLQKQ